MSIERKVRGLLTFKTENLLKVSRNPMWPCSPDFSDIMKGLRSWSWGSFLRYPDKEDRKRIEKKEILPRKELNYQTEANTPQEINDLLNDINKLRYSHNLNNIYGL